MLITQKAPLGRVLGGHSLRGARVCASADVREQPIKPASIKKKRIPLPRPFPASGGLPSLYHSLAEGKFPCVTSLFDCARSKSRSLDGLPDQSGIHRHCFAAAMILDPPRTRRKAMRPPRADASRRIVEALMQNTFHIGQLVRIAHPSAGYSDHRTYCVVCLIAQEGGERLYRIKSMVGLERLVKGDEIEPAALTAVP